MVRNKGGRNENGFERRRACGRVGALHLTLDGSNVGSIDEKGTCNVVRSDGTISYENVSQYGLKLGLVGLA